MNIKSITVVHAQQMLDSREVVLLDRRDTQSYRAGHIEGALHAHDGLIETLIRKRDHSKPVVIYCYLGNASKELAALFSQFGFDSYSVEGGYTAWQKLAPNSMATP